MKLSLKAELSFGIGLLVLLVLVLHSLVLIRFSHWHTQKDRVRTLRESTHIVARGLSDELAAALPRGGGNFDLQRFRPRFQRVLSRFTDLGLQRAVLVNAWEARIEYPDRAGELPPGDQSLLKRAILMKQSAQEFERRAWGLFSGRALLKLVEPLEGSGLPLGALLLSFELPGLQPLASEVPPLWWAFLLLYVGVLVGFGIYLLTRGLAPLDALVAATDRVAAGQFSLSVPEAARNPEMDRLVRSFNQMTGRLQQARDEIVRSEKLASVGVLASGIAHEIGNPLTSIIALVEGMLAGKSRLSARERSEKLERVLRESKRVDETIHLLLDFARPREFRLERIDREALQRGIEESIELVAAQSRFQNIRIRCDVAREFKSVYADTNRLRQVLVNLLLNAGDAIGEGPGEILVRVRADGRHCLLTVEDSGAGIAPEHITRLFDPFFTTKPPGKGTGLGLAIVHQLLSSMGGSIRVHSAPGEGCRFEARLPAEAPRVDASA